MDAAACAADLGAEDASGPLHGAPAKLARVWAAMQAAHRRPAHFQPCKCPCVAYLCRLGRKELKLSVPTLDSAGPCLDHYVVAYTAP